jgi:hypothetical protein
VNIGLFAGLTCILAVLVLGMLNIIALLAKIMAELAGIRRWLERHDEPFIFPADHVPFAEEEEPF